MEGEDELDDKMIVEEERGIDEATLKVKELIKQSKKEKGSRNDKIDMELIKYGGKDYMKRNMD